MNNDEKDNRYSVHLVSYLLHCLSRFSENENIN